MGNRVSCYTLYLYLVICCHSNIYISRTRLIVRVNRLLISSIHPFYAFVAGFYSFLSFQPISFVYFLNVFSPIFDIFPDLFQDCLQEVGNEAYLS